MNSDANSKLIIVSVLMLVCGLAALWVGSSAEGPVPGQKREVVLGFVQLGPYSGRE